MNRRDWTPNSNLTRIRHGWHSRDETLGEFSYTYDPLGQLLSAVQPELTEKFAFDPAGNLIDTALLLPRLEQNAEKQGEYHFPLKKIPHNLIKAYNKINCEYDSHGNMTRRISDFSELKLNYDVENRLVHAIHISKKTCVNAYYFYDAFGRRIAKKTLEEHWNNGHSASNIPTQLLRDTTFVWDGDIMLQECQDKRTYSYIYEPSNFIPLARIYYTEPHHISPGLNDAKEPPTHDYVAYYNCDHQGTPQELYCNNGLLIWQMRSKAWGGTFDSSRGNAQQEVMPLRFLGQYEDVETGLYYNRYRYYDPSLSRYITQDPIGLSGGLNSYSYAPNPLGWNEALLHKSSLTGTFPFPHEFTRYGRTAGAPARSCD